MLYGIAMVTIRDIGLLDLIMKRNGYKNEFSQSLRDTREIACKYYIIKPCC